ncbi:MAG: GNAT family N-acetyltransferase [Acidobacteriia bacterium]|nr:GNAT family N-acetyltransferase [Terriglobia bacterium]
MPEIVRLLMDCRIGADEKWSADIVVEASRGNQLLGCCALDFVGRVAILHSLAIDRQTRRRGIGRALVERCVRLAGARQAHCVVALTMFWNVNFFRKCGFATTSRKLLPPSLANHPLVFDSAFRRATPMIRHIGSSVVLV